MTEPIQNSTCAVFPPWMDGTCVGSLGYLPAQVAFPAMPSTETIMATAIAVLAAKAISIRNAAHRFATTATTFNAKAERYMRSASDLFAKGNFEMASFAFKRAAELYAERGEYIKAAQAHLERVECAFKDPNLEAMNALADIYANVADMFEKGGDFTQVEHYGMQSVFWRGVSEKIPLERLATQRLRAMLDGGKASEHLTHEGPSLYHPTVSMIPDAARIESDLRESRRVVKTARECQELGRAAERR